MDWFKANNIACQLHDYRKEGISADKIKEWLTHEPLEKLLNKNSTTYKELPEEVKKGIVDEESAIKVMVEHCTVIKRPVVEGDRIMAVGFKADQYKAIFTPGA